MSPNNALLPPELALELDPANFDWSCLSYTHMLDADFARTVPLLNGLDGSGGGNDMDVSAPAAGPSWFLGAMGWNGGT